MAELKTTEKMEENRMYYGQEKAESTDAVLTKCGVENQYIILQSINEK